MSFLKNLFGGKRDERNTSDETEQTPHTNEQVAEDEGQFDKLKYDGLRAMRMGQADFAEQFFLAALDIHPDLEINDYLSQLYTRMDEMEKAMEQIQLMAEAEPDNGRIFLRMAHVAYMMEDYDTMTHAAGKAVTLMPDSPDACYFAAKAAIGSEDGEAASQWLDKALLMAPHFAEARLLRAQHFLAMNMMEKAQEDVALLLESHADDEDVLLLKASIQEKQGLHEQAMDTYKRILEVNPFSQEAEKALNQA